MQGRNITRTHQDNILAIVSHELRTTLNAIAGWVRILRLEPPDKATSAQAFGAIEQNIKAHAKLIEDLMDVSRIINGNFRIQMEKVDIVEVIEAAIETLRPAAEEKQIRVAVIPLSDTAQVIADPFRLQQVILNLLSNAIKFTPQGGSIRVEFARKDADLEIKVRDTGRGIESEFLPYVFERFRQARDVANSGQGGIGLGLAIVREIIELHCGTVKADSEGRGKGATFTIRLPLHPPAGFQADVLNQIMSSAKELESQGYSYVRQ